MTSTTAAQSQLAAGEHLVHRPRVGSVVHVYRGGFTPSGRYARSGPACGQRTNRLQVLEPPAGGPLDPAWTRRMCTRCEILLADPAPPTTSAGWEPWEVLTAPQLAVDLSMAVTAAEVDRVAFLALRVLGYAATAAPLQGRDSNASLAERIHARRCLVDEAVIAGNELVDERLAETSRRRRVRDAVEYADHANALADRTGNSVDRYRAARAAEAADAVRAAS